MSTLSNWLTIPEIQQSIKRLKRELDKNDGGPYGVTYQSDLGTVVVTAQQWLNDYKEEEEPNTLEAWMDKKHEQRATEAIEKRVRICKGRGYTKLRLSVESVELLLEQHNKKREER